MTSGRTGEYVRRKRLSVSAVNLKNHLQSNLYFLFLDALLQKTGVFMIPKGIFYARHFNFSKSIPTMKGSQGFNLSSFMILAKSGDI